MNAAVRPDAPAIRQARADNPKMRERDLARQLGISEAEFVAAWCGEGALRVSPDANELLTGLEAVGEVMALTRNESAVHEKIGTYDKVVTGAHSAMVLGEQIDLRIFPKVWAHGFAVEKRDGDEIRRSLQFFDAQGEAVHKVHLRPGSNLYAYQNLVSRLAIADQSQKVAVKAMEVAIDAAPAGAVASMEELRDRWSRLTDTHQFFGMLKALNLTRLQALDMVGQDYAWLLDADAVSAMFSHSVQEQIPIMCFVGNRGCIQIHKGPLQNVQPMGPWLNVMDKTFHLHLRMDHIRQAWVVRKPTKDGHVTSIEAYDAAGEMVIQFFGARHEGEAERGDWRFIAENLPRVPQSSAA
ncbi:hemin-degrading factor [Mesorhizobium sp. L-8-10]|uniref:hemin-degrading factor n=1 Tax=Mesorhizobium sp. L-8-10 TaxID=2744523 RepID=UPI00192745A7|nr:ChuX/HutX family heme-like substrate-binding protein [Mesorhizobium sp. L-8-10]BCH32173.1 hemin-degrading factor [Mesorhizobium sp. L-8-10]